MGELGRQQPHHRHQTMMRRIHVERFERVAFSKKRYRQDVKDCS